MFAAMFSQFHYHVLVAYIWRLECLILFGDGCEEYIWKIKSLTLIHGDGSDWGVHLEARMFNTNIWWQNWEGWRFWTILEESLHMKELCWNKLHSWHSNIVGRQLQSDKTFTCIIKMPSQHRNRASLHLISTPSNLQSVIRSLALAGIRSEHVIELVNGVCPQNVCH